MRHFFQFSLLSTLILTPLLIKSLLDCGTNEWDYKDAAEGSYDVIYKEPHLSGGVEGVDYGIVYGVDDAETEQ
jgi:hypothetical protein